MLLDTNALIWLYRDDSRLGVAARKRIASAAQTHFSSVSTVEIVIKNMLGRLDLPGGAEFPDNFRRSGLVELTFSSEHAAAVARFPTLTHHDPFDRMILAQAVAEGMPVLTSDTTLLTLDEPWIFDARL